MHCIETKRPAPGSPARQEGQAQVSGEVCRPVHSNGIQRAYARRVLAQVRDFYFTGPDADEHRRDCLAWKEARVTL